MASMVGATYGYAAGGGSSEQDGEAETLRQSVKAQTALARESVCVRAGGE